MSNILTFKVEDDLSPPRYIFPTYEEKYYRSSISGPIQGSCQYGLLENFLTAYHHDLPICISPDDIWLLICQGFSQHVNTNSEELRHYFVDFEGRKTITVKRLELHPATATVDDWRDIIAEFPTHLKKQVKDDIVDKLAFNFSTTSLDTRIAGHVTLMSSLQKYFKYRVVMFGCGIPYIQLDGTLEDWENVLEKANSLKKYNLSWWIDQLVPILDQFIQAKKGNIDVEFWKNMIKEKNGSGFYDPGYISGWICKFFPYDRYYLKRRSLEIIYDIEDLFPQILDAPFELELQATNEKIPCKFHSGFMGVSQDPISFVVKPQIGWFITVNDKDDEEEEPIDPQRNRNPFLF